jgi:hypothetical protein
MKKRFAVIAMLALLAAAVLSGCSSGEKEAVKAAARAYAENSMSGNWEEVMKASTGEQLSVLNMLVETLDAASFKSVVRLVEVLDTRVDGNYAEATVHIVRDVKVEDYGTMTDDRQVRYHFYKVNGEWKVYRVEVVLKS